MDQVNGTTKKKHVLFSIGSYNEEKRVIKKIATNGLFSAANAPSQPIQSILKDRPVPQKLKSKPAPLTIVNGENGEDGSAVEVIQKPTCPPSLNNSCEPASKNGPVTDKPAHPPKFEKRSISLEPDQLRHSGKVALTIAAYEGEPKTPMRLEFLPRRNSRASSKASSDEPPPSIDSEDGPIGHRLQNELVATLKRSNLKKRNDPSESESGQNEISPEDKQAPPKEETKEEESQIENGNDKEESQIENGNDKEESQIENGNDKEESQIENGNVNVKKLATVIHQKLAIRE